MAYGASVHNYEYDVVVLISVYFIIILFYTSCSRDFVRVELKPI